MYVTIQQTTAPTGSLITPQLVSQHTRIDENVDTNLLVLYIDTATRTIEKYLNQALLTQTLVMTYAESRPPIDWPMTNVPFPALPLFLEWSMGGLNDGFVELLYGPVQQVSTITENYWDPATDPLLLTEGIDYDLDLNANPARIRMYRGAGAYQSVAVSNYQVTYVAGYGTPAQVPTPIIHATLMTVARMYENRGDTDGDEVLTRNARSLLDNYRRIVFA